METKDWSQHFEDLKKFVGISTNNEWLSESGQDKKIQSGEDLKTIWAERYKNSDTCCLRLKVISENISENGENEERMYMDTRTKEGERGEEQTGIRDQSGNKFIADKMIGGEEEEGKTAVSTMEYKQKKVGNIHEFNDDEKKEDTKISHEKPSKTSP
ncbi:WD repeat-containing protein, partial [Reticulomyxa filosa]